MTTFNLAKKQKEEDVSCHWRSLIDPRTGAPYYCNVQTGKTQWTRPTDSVILPYVTSQQRQQPQGGLALVNSTAANGNPPKNSTSNGLVSLAQSSYSSPPKTMTTMVTPITNSAKGLVHAGPQGQSLPGRNFMMEGTAPGNAGILLATNLMNIANATAQLRPQLQPTGIMHGNVSGLATASPNRAGFTVLQAKHAQMQSALPPQIKNGFSAVASTAVSTNGNPTTSFGPRNNPIPMIQQHHQQQPSQPHSLGVAAAGTTLVAGNGTSAEGQPATSQISKRKPAMVNIQGEGRTTKRDSPAAVPKLLVSSVPANQQVDSQKDTNSETPSTVPVPNPLEAYRAKHVASSTATATCTAPANGAHQSTSDIQDTCPSSPHSKERMVWVNFGNGTQLAYLLSVTGDQALVRWESTRLQEEVSMDRVEELDSANKRMRRPSTKGAAKSLTPTRTNASQINNNNKWPLSPLNKTAATTTTTPASKPTPASTAAKITPEETPKEPNETTISDENADKILLPSAAQLRCSKSTTDASKLDPVTPGGGLVEPKPATSNSSREIATESLASVMEESAQENACSDDTKAMDVDRPEKEAQVGSEPPNDEKEVAMVDVKKADTDTLKAQVETNANKVNPRTPNESEDTKQELEEQGDAAMENTTSDDAGPGQSGTEGKLEQGSKGRDGKIADKEHLTDEKADDMPPAKKVRTVSACDSNLSSESTERTAPAEANKIYMRYATENSASEGPKRITTTFHKHEGSRLGVSLTRVRGKIIIAKIEDDGVVSGTDLEVGMEIHSINNANIPQNLQEAADVLVKAAGNVTIVASRGAKVLECRELDETATTTTATTPSTETAGVPSASAVGANTPTPTKVSVATVVRDRKMLALAAAAAAKPTTVPLSTTEEEESAEDEKDGESEAKASKRKATEDDEPWEPGKGTKKEQASNRPVRRSRRHSKSLYRMQAMACAAATAESAGEESEATSKPKRTKPNRNNKTNTNTTGNTSKKRKRDAKGKVTKPKVEQEGTLGQRESALKKREADLAKREETLSHKEAKLEKIEVYLKRMEAYIKERETKLLESGVEIDSEYLGTLAAKLVATKEVQVPTEAKDPCSDEMNPLESSPAEASAEGAEAGIDTTDDMQGLQDDILEETGKNNEKVEATSVTTLSPNAVAVLPTDVEVRSQSAPSTAEKNDLSSNEKSSTFQPDQQPLVTAKPRVDGEQSQSMKTKAQEEDDSCLAAPVLPTESPATSPNQPSPSTLAATAASPRALVPFKIPVPLTSPNSTKTARIGGSESKAALQPVALPTATSSNALQTAVSLSPAPAESVTMGNATNSALVVEEAAAATTTPPKDSQPSHPMTRAKSGRRASARKAPPSAVVKTTPTKKKSERVKARAKKVGSQAAKVETPKARNARNASKKVITLTPRDAVFGRGRKKSQVRHNNLYRLLVERHCHEYATLDASNFKHRKAYVKKKIVDVVLKYGGRFIMRQEHGLSILDMNRSVDEKLIYKKIQRALFNEKKRREDRDPNWASKSEPGTFNEDDLPFSPADGEEDLEGEEDGADGEASGDGDAEGEGEEDEEQNDGGVTLGEIDLLGPEQEELFNLGFSFEDEHEEEAIASGGSTQDDNDGSEEDSTSTPSGASASDNVVTQPFESAASPDGSSVLPSGTENKGSETFDDKGILDGTMGLTGGTDASMFATADEPMNGVASFANDHLLLSGPGVPNMHNFESLETMMF